MRAKANFEPIRIPSTGVSYAGNIDCDDCLMMHPIDKQWRDEGKSYVQPVCWNCNMPKPWECDYLKSIDKDDDGQLWIVCGYGEAND